MKQFLIIGAVTCCGYKDVFPYIKTGEVKYRPQKYGVKQYLNSDKKVTATWYTTMETPYIPPLELTKTYNPEDYPKLDNYDAINVNHTRDIPYDYDGVMAVPITFLDKWNPDQFEIITIAAGWSWANLKEDLIKLNFNPDLRYGVGLGVPGLNDKGIFERIIVKKKQHNEGQAYLNGESLFSRLMIQRRGGGESPYLNGNKLFQRIFIKRR